VIDEAAFAKNGDNKVDGSMMGESDQAHAVRLWRRGVSLLEFGWKEPRQFFL
jgi:hypothetical protein